MTNSFVSNVSDNLTPWVLKTAQFVKTIYQKYAVISLSAKVIIVTTLFAVTPISIKPLNNLTYNTNIKFDKTKPLVMLTTSKPVKIELGESEFDRTEREKIIASSYSQAKLTVESSVSTQEDPTDFRPIYKQVGMQFGIPWQLIEAVHEVESGKSGSTSKRSYAGAQGPMQFMPGTWRHYGVDGNGDGVADANNVVDAIYGGANLLAQSGAAEGDIDGALFNYNHAMWYVNKVKAVAYEIGM